MDLTRQNLDRIQDLCIEVGRQTKRLAAEAQRARRHRTLRDQVRRLELTLALQEFEILQQRQVTLHQQLSEVRGELEISGREWREWQAQWRQFEQSWQEFQNDQQQCRERIGDIENKLALNRRDQDHLTSRRQQADQRLAEERQRQLSLEERRKEWLTEQTDLKTQLAQLAKALGHQTDQLAALEESLTAGRTQRQLHSVRLDELKGELVDTLASKAQAHNSVIASRRQLQELDQRALRRRQEQAELSPRLDEANQAVDDLKQQLGQRQQQLTTLKTAQTQLRGATQEVRGQLGTLRKEWRQMEDRYRKDHSRLQALKELESRYEWYHQDVRTLLLEQRPSESGKAPADVLARFLDVNPASMQAAEAVFGDLLHALVTDSFEDLQGLVKELKQHQGAQAQFLPLPLWRLVQARDQVPAGQDNGFRPLIAEIQAAEAVQPLLGRLLSRVFLADDWDSALEQWLDSPFTNSFVTPEGDCLFADGRVLARSPVAGQTLLHKRHEIRELEKQCAEFQNGCEAKEDQVKQAEQAHDELEQRIAATEQEARSEEESCRRAEQASLQWQTDRQKWLTKLELLAAEDLREDEERQFHQDTLTVHEELQQQYGLAESKLRAQLETVDGNLHRLQANVEASEKDFLSRKIAQSQDQQRERQLHMDQERMAKQLSEAADLLTACHEQQDQIRKDLEQWVEQQSALEYQQRDLDEARRTEQQRQQQLEAGQKELQHRQTELEARRDHLKQLYRVRQRNEQQWQSELSEASMQMDFLRRRILEHHRVELERWRSDPDLDLIPSEELMHQLEEARQRLERLGEARYAAIDEFDEQKQRLDFLESQRQDLEKTIQDLQQTIQQIQRTSRKRFLETFMAVDTQLHGIFPVLFGGGSARLQLLDEDHPLESGVELLVKLPGKRTTAMSLLSGGEKALTALALLFAISITKPSPFLLLDEVDAPLDDVNVGRFCDLIHTLQERSQVVLISHNQRTMEIAHQLIGVTMDEPGVSRVIHLELEPQRVV
ncbi:MAG TPA: chromosome segregation protein SMC [Syntrophobacteraceae bacterium]|nr:chromosome segregation protein SMC [Syntrophobacteraceae bacterium]